MPVIGGLKGSSRLMVNGTLKSMRGIFRKYANKDSKSVKKKKQSSGRESESKNSTYSNNDVESYKINDNLYVNSLDMETGKIVHDKITGISRQWVEEDIVDITLANGLKITTVCYQRFVTRRGIKTIDQCVVGSFIAIPSILLQCKQAKSKLKVTKPLVILLAWQIAEGYEPSKTNINRMSITQKDETVLHTLKGYIHEIADEYDLDINNPRITPATVHHNAPDLVVHSIEYRLFMVDKGYKWGELSAGKSFPDFIMNACNDYIILFIRAYMDGEAHFSHKAGTIEMCTASRAIALQMFILLMRIGINSTILVKIKCATNTEEKIKRTYYEVHVSGAALRIYRDKISFGVDYKKEGLDDVCDNRKTNTNTEIIPMHQELAKLRRLTGISMSLVINKMYFNGKRNPSINECHLMMTRLKAVYAIPEDKVAWKIGRCKNYMTPERKHCIKSFMKFLKTELTKQVRYIKIKSIDHRPRRGWVYNITTKTHNNYVVEGMLCASI